MFLKGFKSCCNASVSRRSGGRVQEHYHNQCFLSTKCLPHYSSMASCVWEDVYVYTYYFQHTEKGFIQDLFFLGGGGGGKTVCMALQNFVVLIAVIVATFVYAIVQLCMCIKIDALLKLNRKKFLHVLLPWYALLTKLAEQRSV